MEEFEIKNMQLYHYNKIKNSLELDFDDFWNKDMLKEELQNENSRYIVALKNDEIVGFAGIKYNFDSVEIMNIVTKKSYRRKGIAFILLKNLIVLSKQFKTKKIQLEVNEKNIPAINLYKKIGFNVVGIRKKYYNGIFDAILMDYIL